MKVLYYGGQKSGKSTLAEEHTLTLSGDRKPYYVATYDNSYGDKEMHERLQRHQTQRQAKFITIEEPKALSSLLEAKQTYLIDCMSMWILNTLGQSEEELVAMLNTLEEREANIIFVLNEVTAGVIPLDAESRRYVDRSGIVGQHLARMCDEVYEVKLGLKRRLK